MGALPLTKDVENYLQKEHSALHHTQYRTAKHEN